VFPHEVVKATPGYNVAAVIFAHNHPSGVAEPSRADELLTQSLKHGLSLVDIRTLDHFVVAGLTVLSFAEGGDPGLTAATNVYTLCRDKNLAAQGNAK